MLPVVLVDELLRLHGIGVKLAESVFSSGSQVKIYSPGYIEQCAAGPSCPVRGGVGCKRCSSSVSCVG